MSSVDINTAAQAEACAKARLEVRPAEPVPATRRWRKGDLNNPAVTALEHFLARFDISSFPITINLCVIGGDTLEASIFSRDRDTGAPSRGIRHARISPRMFDAYIDADGFVESTLFEMVRALVLHELEESWLCDGVRIRDPHAPHGLPMSRLRERKTTANNL